MTVHDPMPPGRRRACLARALRMLVVATVAVGAPKLSQAAADLLDARRAFPMRAEFDGRTVIVRYSVAGGYYLYRKKLRFAVDTAGVRLGVPALPKGTVTDDEFFGRTEIYRGDVEVRIPLEKGTPAPESIVLRATSQGCADAGVCYPPREDRLTLIRGAGPVSTLPVDTGRKSFLDSLQGEP